MIRDLGAAAAVALAAAATLRADVRAGANRWLPDSYDYAIRMLVRTGMPEREAQDRARAFLKGVSAHANDPRYAQAYEGEPPWWTLFAPRIVYPSLAALLYRRRGFDALTDIAGASYVASAVALYAFLRRYGCRTSALAVTLWYVRRRSVRDVASLALCDSTAMLFWILTLDAMAGLAAGGRGWLRLAALSAALSFTRPLPYLPLAAGLMLALRGGAARDGARARTGAGIAAVAVGCAVAVAAVLSRSGAPSTREHFGRMRTEQRAEQYDGQLDRAVALLHLEDAPSHSLMRWYATSVGLALATSLKHAATAVVPLIAVPGFARAKRPDVPLLLGALAGGVLGCIADPAPRATRRTIVLPLLPVFAAGCVLAIAHFTGKGSRGSGRCP